MNSLLLTRGATFVVWAVVAASAAFWSLRLFVPVAPVPGQASSVTGAQALRGDPARVLGRGEAAAPAVAVVPAEASRFRLLGVVAPRSPQAAGEGLALIEIDGKRAKAYRVGAVIEGDLVLQRVRARGADLGARQAETASVALDIVPPPPAATGTLPSSAAVVPGAPGRSFQMPLPRPVPPQTLPQDLPSPEQDDNPELTPSEPPPPTTNLRQGPQTQ